MLRHERFIALALVLIALLWLLPLAIAEHTNRLESHYMTQKQAFLYTAIISVDVRRMARL